MKPLLAALLAGAALLAVSGAQAAGPRTLPEVAANTALPVTDPVQMGEWLKRVVGNYEFEGLVEVAYSHEGEDYEEHRCAPLPQDAAKVKIDKPDPIFVPYCSSIHGKGDCIAIGTGPGVQCILGVTWQDFREWIPPPEDISDPPGGDFELPGGTSNLSPAMVLFGLDPGASRLKYLLVDQKGLPEGGPGFIKGDRATFTTACVNAPSMFAGMKPPPNRPPRPEGSPQTCERITRIDAKPDAKVLHWSMDININGEVWTRFEMTLRRKS